MADKKKIKTPKGELVYCNVTGVGKLDYDGKFYEYTAGIKLDKKTAKKFYKEICKHFDENKPSWFKGSKPSNSIMREIKNDDNFLFQFKTKVEFEDDKGNVRPTKIGLANAKGKQVILPDGEGIGNGTLGKIGGSMSIHSDSKSKTAGVSLWLNNLQISKYVKYVVDMGFDEDEDGEFEEFGTELEETGEDKPKKKKKKKK